MKWSGNHAQLVLCVGQNTNKACVAYVTYYDLIVITATAFTAQTCYIVIIQSQTQRETYHCGAAAAAVTEQPDASPFIK